MDRQPDRGLRLRMGVTVVLPFGLYVAFVGVLTLYVGGLLVPAVLLGGFSILQYVFCDELALRSMGAATVTGEA